MTIRHLRIFVAVCDNGSVTAAAKKFSIAQSSASLAVAELEKYYGQQLFDRISNRLHVTEIGKQFYTYASHIVSLFDTLETGIKDWDNIGMLRIGTSVTIGIHLLPELANRFNEIYPEISIKGYIDNSETIERLVLKGDVDFGLIEGICHSEYLKVVEFMDDELVFICPVEHPFASRSANAVKPIFAEELSTQPFILREPGSAGREIFDGMMEMKGINITPLWQSVSTQAIVEAVIHGIGISVLPMRLVQKELDAGLISAFEVDGISLKRKFSLIHHQNKLLTKSADTFIRLILSDK